MTAVPTPTFAAACCCGKVAVVPCPTLTDVFAARAALMQDGWRYGAVGGFACSAACAERSDARLSALRAPPPVAARRLEPATLDLFGRAAG